MVFLCLTYRYCTILCKSSYWMNRLFLIMLSIITGTGTVTKQILARWKLKFSVFIILCAKLSIIGDFKTGSHTVKYRYRYLLNSWLWTRIRNHCTVSKKVNSWIPPGSGSRRENFARKLPTLTADVKFAEAPLCLTFYFWAILYVFHYKKLFIR